MTEPPTKRARRMDSSTMWDISDKKSRPNECTLNPTDGSSKGNKDDARLPAPTSRTERRQQSRSRNKDGRRRDQSRSRERKTREDTRDTRREGERDPRAAARDRDRSRSRDRDYTRRDYHSKSSRYHERSRSRSRSPTRHNTKIRTRSPPRRGSKPDRRDIGSRSVPPDDDKGPNGSTGRKGHSSISKGTDGIELDMDLENGEVDSLIFKTMGFKSFRSTQNTKVPGNQIYGVRKEKKTEYRQYMNRVGGFNRPLSPSR